MRIFLFIAGAVLIHLAPNTHGVDLIALDNTNNLALSPGTSISSIFVSTWNAVVFSVGPVDAVMKDLTLNLLDTSSTSQTVNFRLFAVDGGNNPTGSALASDSFTQAFTSAGTYYTVATTMGGFTMLSGQKYALVVNSNSPSSGWSFDSSGGFYTAYTAAGGWSYVARRRTTNSGGTWNSSSTFPGLKMTVTPVPEPSTVILTGLAFGGLAISRGRRKSR